MSSKNNIFVLVGPPGSGKGSLSQLCIKEFGWKQLSTGDLCRKHIAEQTEIGKQIDFALKSGKLVNDGIIVDMVNKWLTEQIKSGANVLLDGYPRNLVQARALDAFLKDEKFAKIELRVVRFVASDEVVINRLSSRCICSNKDCQAVYSMAKDSSFRPKENMICDTCSSPLKIRSDDNLDSIKERLKIYHEYEDSMLHFYSEVGYTILEVDAERSLKDVFENFKTVVGLKD